MAVYKDSDKILELYTCLICQHVRFKEAFAHNYMIRTILSCSGSYVRKKPFYLTFLNIMTNRKMCVDFQYSVSS